MAVGVGLVGVRVTPWAAAFTANESKAESHETASTPRATRLNFKDEFMLTWLTAGRCSVNWIAGDERCLASSLLNAPRLGFCPKHAQDSGLKC